MSAGAPQAGDDAFRTSPFRDLVPALTSGRAVIESLAPPQR